jgi:hypothetical protein
MRSLFSNLNARLIIIHLVAFWFFIYGFESLGFLHDHKFFNPLYDRINRVTFPDRYNADKTFVEQAGNIGLVLAYIISWFVCSKKSWHWFNGVIAFVVAFGLNYCNWFGWDHFYKIFLTPGRIFNVGSIWRYITDGGIMVVIGLLLLLLNIVIRFIEKGNPEYKRKVEADKIARRLK